MDNRQLLRACMVLAILVLESAAWPYGGRGGNRRGNGGWRPGRVDRDGFGLSEECPAILATASQELSDIATEMPAHYKELIPELEPVFADDFLDYPMEADINLYSAIGELAIAAENIESVSEMAVSRQCKRQLMLALKKLNSAISVGVSGLRSFEEALALRANAPQERLQEWIGAFSEVLSVRNDILGCFVTMEIVPEGDEGEGEGEGGNDGEIPEGGDGSQNPPALP